MDLIQRMSKYRVNEYNAFLSFPLARVNFQNARDKHFYASDIGASTVSLFPKTSHRLLYCVLISTPILTFSSSFA